MSENSDDIDWEELRRVGERILGPTLRDENVSPEVRARTDALLKWSAELDAKNARQATEQQKKNWQDWGDSELRRIEREQDGRPR